MSAPFSPAADRNKEPILEVLRDVVDADDRRLLEVGSGSGQHGAFFGSQFPNLSWVLSDREENHEGIKLWKREAGLDNLEGPLAYEIGKDPFPAGRFDIVFTANTFHIMSWKHVKTLIKALETRVRPGARFVVYGPFKYHDKETSRSNLEFDQMLRQRDPASGLRHFEDVKSQMEARGFRLLKDNEMPANNRALVFIKVV